ncbi:hypothetical protein [Anoxybacterium hadale]|uniref:hypothetical protein n=1 Tax=Anoxybacterium hadale TaxID=3408580 RepID=UPI003B001DEE
MKSGSGSGNRSSVAGGSVLWRHEARRPQCGADPCLPLRIPALQGCVIVSADDPGMHSSQNEQDNRNYAAAARVLMLEPSDSQEAKDFTKLGLELSERFDTPCAAHDNQSLSQ